MLDRPTDTPPAPLCTVDGLAGALAAGQLYLVFQPIFEPVADRVTGAEALVRWRHPIYGTISPATFLPLAEQSGLSLAIGRWVLGTACLRAAAWRRAGHPLGVAVNVSRRQFADPELVAEVAQALRASGLPPSALTLEVEESTLLADRAASRKRLRTLRALAVRIAADGVGPGHASVEALASLPVHAIKIDRSAADGHGELVRATVALARGLGLETFTEGIEAQHQLERLRYEQFDYAQGFRFARPLEAPALEKLLRDGLLVAGAGA